MNFCDCTKDGFCPRYQRDMYGRNRQICAGVNVDLGTAAAFRAQWARETPIKPFEGKPQLLLLKTDQAPGDALAMTAAIYSLHRAQPGRYLTAVESYWPAVFAHNPDVYTHVVPGKGDVAGIPIQMHYPAIHQSNERAIHFMKGWCEFLGSALGISVPLMTNRPHLYFSFKNKPPVEDYWIICNGGKRDFTTKLWGYSKYQKVVELLKGKVRFVQVGGTQPVVEWSELTKGTQEDYHPPIDGAENMVGKTSLRDLFELVRRSRGVVCGVSLLMHVAAALEKPAIVIAGGREPVPWNAYPKQHYLHTVGMLPCKDIHGRSGACWRYRTVPLNDGNDALDKDTCERPVDGTPECMNMITPQEVVNLVLRYS